MFCSHCGTSLAPNARYCSSCGTEVHNPTQASRPTHNPPSASPVHQFSPPTPTSPHLLYATHTPPSSNLKLVDDNNIPTQGFHDLAIVFFHTLDNPPTGSLEPCKLVHWRQMTGQAIPPQYAEIVLPTYYQTIGAETVLSPYTGSPALTLLGWETFLLQKILSSPWTALTQLSMAMRALNLPVTLRIDDLPSAPDSQATNREAEFRMRMVGLVNSAYAGIPVGQFGMGGLGGNLGYGGYGGYMGGGFGGGNSSSASSTQTQGGGQQGGGSGSAAQTAVAVGKFGLQVFNALNGGGSGGGVSGF